MAESSGFFTAMVDEETGGYDRKYIARQFADYFSLFFKNGVFGSPTNQLLVKPGTDGLSIIVSQGYAFVHGYWYHNDSDKVIPLVTNYGNTMRTDSVRVRMSEETRDMTVDVYTDSMELERGEDTYDLQLATVQVPPMVGSITAANIRDTRPDESVCGFVSGLMKVQTTADLFNQFQSMFDEWFDRVKGQLSEDAAGNLQSQIDDLQTLIGNEVKLLTRDITGQLVWMDGYGFNDRGQTPPSVKKPQINLFALKSTIFHDGQSDLISSSKFGIEFLFSSFTQKDYVPADDDHLSMENKNYSFVNVYPKTTGVIRNESVNYANVSKFSLEAAVYGKNLSEEEGSNVYGGLYVRHIGTLMTSFEDGSVGIIYYMDRSATRLVAEEGAKDVGSYRPCLPYAAILYGVEKKIAYYEVRNSWENGYSVNKQFFPENYWKD